MFPLMKFSLLSFQDNFVSALRGDASRGSESRIVKGAAYSFIDPTPISKARLVGWSSDLAQLFGLQRPDAEGLDADLLAGHRTMPGLRPYAANYGGHQFGRWAGQLGDGRAINLGNVKDLSGQSWEFQLKGAGRTPYSRGADGRAVLRSSLREFICSEAMFHLNVPTTRALSLTMTGESVIRDLLYDGHPRPEPGAIVCRVSPSFVRFGNFEILAARNEIEILNQLLGFVVQQNFPELGPLSEEMIPRFFEEVCSRTALMICHWMRVGFVHGVMNTDNMSILGLTIDYGPYGWIDNYDPSWTPNTTDLPGRRYCYGQQPSIAYWNLQQLARALAVLIPDRENELHAGLETYKNVFNKNFLEMMAKKMGLPLGHPKVPEVFGQLDELLVESDCDMAIFFRGLAEVELSPNFEETFFRFLTSTLYQNSLPEQTRQKWQTWLEVYKSSILDTQFDSTKRKLLMNETNPLYVPRNYLLQQAIEAAEQNDFSEIEKLLEVFKNPYTLQKGKEAYALKRPDWAKDKPGCSTLSCSS